MKSQVQNGDHNNQHRCDPTLYSQSLGIYRQYPNVENYARLPAKRELLLFERRNPSSRECSMFLATFRRTNRVHGCTVPAWCTKSNCFPPLLVRKIRRKPYLNILLIRHFHDVSSPEPANTWENKNWIILSRQLLCSNNTNRLKRITVVLISGGSRSYASRPR